MKFSVLMSIYDKENPTFFDQSIDSIIKQTLKPTEIVIVKDGPINSGLDNIIIKYTKLYPGLLKIVNLEKNVGLGEALRIGLSYCSNEIIARMDTDDICLSNRFERQIPLIIKDKSIAVLGSWIAEFENDPKRVKAIKEVPLSYEDIKKKARYRNPLNHMSVVFRKSLVEAVGSYQSFYLNEDYYLWARLLLNGYKIININDVLVLVRAGDNLYARRGGINYIKNEIKLQSFFLKSGFTSKRQFFYNIIIRSFVHLVPNKVRKIIYKKLLRRSPAKV